MVYLSLLTCPYLISQVNCSYWVWESCHSREASGRSLCTMQPVVCIISCSLLCEHSSCSVINGVDTDTSYVHTSQDTHTLYNGCICQCKLWIHVDSFSVHFTKGLRELNFKSTIIHSTHTHTPPTHTPPTPHRMSSGSVRRWWQKRRENMWWVATLISCWLNKRKWTEREIMRCSETCL